ncbi:MAG: hypothetical protein L6R35_006519 [Caloplaca aegaea]|nr:MAG: hypothetical protein L6R35_006519 [Caloplaca aegaea]
MSGSVSPETPAADVCSSKVAVPKDPAGPAWEVRILSDADAESLASLAPKATD